MIKVITFFINIVCFVNGNVEDAISSIGTGLHKISTWSAEAHGTVEQNSKLSVF